MAKNKKKRRSETAEVNHSLEGLKRLKVGQVVMYRTKQLFDKCTVESVNKENNTAKLNNGIVLSIGILPNGSLSRIGNSAPDTDIRVWDEECEKLYSVFVCTRNIRKLSEAFRKFADSNKSSADSIIELSNRLTRLKERYGIEL